MRSIPWAGAAAALLALALAGCGAAAPPKQVETAPPPPPKVGAPPPTTTMPKPRAANGGGAPYVEVEVFYATDRARTGSPRPGDFFGTGRGALQYGVAGVSIPRGHKTGELESPSWWKLEFSQDPSRHVVLLKVAPMQAADFHGGIAQRTAAAGQRNVLVFIHGFNVTFEDALRRTGQIAYDLQFPGTPIAYSWPSQGTPAPLGYTTDENNVEWTEPHLKQFLVDLKAGVGGDVRIHLVAHSMGNRALTKVLRSLAADNRTAMFNQVVLAAPDIDREVFESQIAPAILRTAQRTTLYASSQDRALMLSETIHSLRRAGQSNPPLVLVKGLDTIDATGIDTSALGHSYIASEPFLLNDLILLIRHNLTPLDRNLRSRAQGQDRYWTFPR